MSNRISRQPGFERFGTDAVEWWQDGDAAARVWIQVMRETDGYPWRLAGDVHAMSEGSVGWAGGRAEFDASEGPVELLAQTGEFEFETAREVERKGVEGLQKVYPLAAVAG